MHAGVNLLHKEHILSILKTHVISRCESNRCDWCIFFSCPSGLQPNQVVDIECHCQAGHCAFGLSRFETRFGITSDFERKLDFRCLDNYELYEDSMLDKCLNLPHVTNGEWLCSDNGTCSLAYVLDMWNFKTIGEIQNLGKLSFLGRSQKNFFLFSYERVDRVDHVGINFLVYIQGGSSKTAKMSSKTVPVFVGKRHYRFFCYIAQNDRQS